MAAVTIAVISESKKTKFVIASTFIPCICHEVMIPHAMILGSWMLSCKPAFSLSLSASSRGSLLPLHFPMLEWYRLHIWGCWYFSWQSWFQLVIHAAWHFMWCTLHIIYINRVIIHGLVVVLSQFWTSCFVQPLKKYTCNSMFHWDIFRLVELGCLGRLSFPAWTWGLTRSTGCDGGEEDPHQSSQQVHRVPGLCLRDQDGSLPGDDHHERRWHSVRCLSASWERGWKGLADCAVSLGPEGLLPTCWEWVMRRSPVILKPSSLSSGC